METTKLIYDLGMNDGNDSAYYLALGYHVIAIEANSALVERAKSRFKTEISQGKLRVLNLAIGATSGAMPFWICDSDHGWSSLDESRLLLSGAPHHRVDVECRSISNVIAENGIPYYLKIDIEGYEQMCLDGLRPELAPSYLSLELFSVVDDSDGGHRAILKQLRKLGYASFALINQETHTASTPIFRSEAVYRVLRKACHISPLVKNILRSLPNWLRPKKIDFDARRAKVSESGTFGTDIQEKWLSGDETEQRAEWLWCNARESKHRGCHFDLHCRR